LAWIVRALCTVVGRCWWPLVAAVAVTVAVSLGGQGWCPGALRLCVWCEHPIPAKCSGIIHGDVVVCAEQV
jgi:hypothetical protein